MYFSIIKKFYGDLYLTQKKVLKNESLVYLYQNHIFSNDS